jgi:hypothetical protein
MLQTRFEFIEQPSRALFAASGIVVAVKEHALFGKDQSTRKSASRTPTQSSRPPNQRALASGSAKALNARAGAAA